MIELQGITKSFGTLQVLKGIDLMIEKGEVVSLSLIHIFIYFAYYFALIKG